MFSLLAIAGAITGTVVGLAQANMSPADASQGRTSQAQNTVTQQKTAPVKLTQDEAASRLAAAGIPVASTGNCSDPTRTDCTALEQINAASIDGIITLAEASGCPITVTGGTEMGHAQSEFSHENGYKIDVPHTDCIDAYVQNSFSPIENRATDGAPQYRSNAGNIYADEDTHWDILFVVR